LFQSFPYEKYSNDFSANSAFTCAFYLKKPNVCSIELKNISMIAKDDYGKRRISRSY